ncbi:hypothetical protein Hypma_015111 [Hypsizygus marmoreus]|uniref:Uncharacterized protein n=1 Tax=Hypsizygus marmoreus TaxID=39966 RepID=A0A369KB56_HYPMA|nr:hypothetical protein Hypma_015111 [Hypsizygus marmoreus]
MSGRSSYPSPLSSTTSPIMNDDVAEPTAPARIVTEPVARDHSETHRSLQQASAALEAAYLRIRQVRRNLLEMTDTLPSSERRSQEGSNIGPNHESITLAGGLDADAVGSGEDSATRDALSPVSTTFEERLRQFEATIQSDLQRRSERYQELPPVTPSPTHSTPPPSNQTTIRRPPILPRRSQLESQFARRREIAMDDAATSLGRRVAARQAAGSLNSQPNVTPSRRSTLGSENNSTRLVATIERDIEHFRSLARQRRSEPTPATVLEGLDLADRTNRTVDNPTSRLTHPHSLVTGDSPSRRFSLVPQQEMRSGDSRRRRFLLSNSPISSQSERLSLLSNFSVQNLSTPVSAGIPRPLLFDEPASYIPAANFTQPSADGVESASDTGEERNYTIRRRLNADGEEHVHPINLDWLRLDEDAQSWLMPRDPNDDPMSYPERSVYNRAQRRDTVQPAQNGGTSESPAGPPRRRGWARLDPDGNEIPSDEEEELERVRAEYRVQAQSRPRPPNNLFGTGFDARPGLLQSLHAPTTSTSLAPDDDADLNEDVIPRVRLNARDSRPFVGTVMDSVIAVDTLCKDAAPAVYSSPPVSPFCPYPLPMPLEEMVWSAPKTRPTRVVRVHKHANLAGR